MLNCVPAVWFRLNPMVSTCFKAMFTSKLDSLISRCPSRISNFSSSICCSHKAYYPDKPGKWERSEIKVKSSLESVTEADVVPSKKKRSRRREMMDYYTLNEHLKSTYFIIPKQFWTVRHSVDLFYLAEEPTADKLFCHIIKHIPTTCEYVIEVNPGPGLLTEKLLNHGYQLRIFEGTEPFVAHMEEIQSQHPHILSIQLNNFLQLPIYVRQDYIDNGSRTEAVLRNIKPQDWESDSLKIILGIPKEKFLIHLIYDCYRKVGLPSYGRPEMYCIIPPSQLVPYITAPDHKKEMYRHKAILFQTVFDFEILDELSRASFLPWHTYKGSARNTWRSKLKRLDTNYMYLVKISGKRDFYRMFGDLETVELYQKFICQFFRRPNFPVIPILERWFPNCGPKVINQGHGIFTLFSDLSPSEALALFQLCRTLPGFEKAPFFFEVELEEEEAEEEDDEMKDESTKMKKGEEEDDVMHHV
nr:PREDICTED: dimethyladenosine transferase 2, mitochondrial [Bemisia tabaci]